MGLEVVPMFNCWGHASGSRIRHGRHVVLDQNPRLAPLFEPDGWTWCLTNPRAQALLRSVCDELTTWHRLARCIPALHFTAACMWSQDQAALGLRQAGGSLARAATASVLRKLVPSGGAYRDSGWNPFEMPAEPD